MAKIEFKAPRLPFSANINGGLAPGREITIKGRANFHIQRRFCINFGVEPQYRENLALHIGQNIDENVIILTTLNMGAWAPGQRTQNLMNFTDKFEFQIKVEQNHFRVSLNNRHLGDVAHQFPPHMVNHIEVEGGCEIKYIFIEGRSQMQSNMYATPASTMYPPQQAPMYAQPPQQAPMYAQPQQAPPMYAPQPPPVYAAQPAPVYVPQPVYVAQPPVVVVEEDHHHHGGMSAGGAMLAGALIGSAMTRRRGPVIIGGFGRRRW